MPFVKLCDVWLNPAQVVSVEATEFVGVTDIVMSTGSRFRTDLSQKVVVGLLSGWKSKSDKRGKAIDG